MIIFFGHIFIESQKNNIEQMFLNVCLMLFCCLYHAFASCVNSHQQEEIIQSFSWKQVPPQWLTIRVQKRIHLCEGEIFEYCFRLYTEITPSQWYFFGYSKLWWCPMIHLRMQIVCQVTKKRLFSFAVTLNK